MGAKKKGKKKKAPQIGFGFGGGPRMYLHLFLIWYLGCFSVINNLKKTTLLSNLHNKEKAAKS